MTTVSKYEKFMALLHGLCNLKTLPERFQVRFCKPFQSIMNVTFQRIYGLLRITITEALIKSEPIVMRTQE